MRLYFSRNRILNNSVISLLGFFVSGVFGYLFQLVLARRLSVEQYGEFQSLLALFALLGVASSALSYFVITHTAVFAAARDGEANQRFVRGLERWLLPAAGALLGVLLVLAPAVRGALHLSESWGFIVVGLAVLVSFLTVLYQGTLTGWEEFLAVNAVIVLGAVLKLALGLSIVLLFPRAAPVTFAVLLSAIGTWLLSRRLERARVRAHQGDCPPTDGNWRARYFPTLVVPRDLGFVTLFTLLITLLQHLDLLLVRHLVSPELAGQYSALNLAGKVVLWANLGIVTVVLPAAVAQAHAGKRLSSATRWKATGLVVGLSGVALLVYAGAPRLFLRLLFGSPYLRFAQSLWLFGGAALVLSLLMLEAHFAFARRDARVLGILGSVAALAAGGIFFFSPSIPAMVTSLSVTLCAGYGGILALNVFSVPKRTSARAEPRADLAVETAVIPQ